MEMQNVDVESGLESEQGDLGGLVPQPGNLEDKTEQSGERREQNTEVESESTIFDDETSPRIRQSCRCCHRKCCGVDCSPRRWVVVGVVVVVVIVAVALLCYFLRPTTIEDIEYQLAQLTDRELIGSYPTSKEDFARRKAVFEKFLVGVKGMSISHWSHDDEIRLDILKTYVQTFIDGHDWWDYGNLVPFPIISFRDRCDSVDGLGREGLADRINWKISLMKRGLMLNRTAHNLTVKNELKEITKMLNTCSNKTSRDALTKMVSFLENDYIPHLRRTPGVYAWSNGLAYYNACLRWHIGLDTGAQKLYDQGNSDVTRIKGHMQKLLQDFQFSGTVGEYKEYRERKREFFPFSNEKMLFGAFISAAYTVLPKLDTVFRTDVNIDLPRFESKNEEGVYVQYGYGIMFVNTTNTSSFNKHDILPLILHELFPGHHYQGLYKYRIRDQAYDPPRYMFYLEHFAIPTSFPYFTSFVEGWGLYSEFLGVELGVLNDPHDRYAAYEAELLRAGRLVYDTGIHAFGWTVQDAKTFLSSIGVPDAVADVEILNAVNMPGRSCSYTTGEKYFKKLRAQAKVELGSLFDVREFHHAVLNTGEEAPLVVVKKSVDFWIRQKLKAFGKT